MKGIRYLTLTEIYGMYCEYFGENYLHLPYEVKKSKNKTDKGDSFTTPQISQNIRITHYISILYKGETTSDWWFPHTKGQ